MAYLVLARKWRPQGFSDLVGQEHVSQTLGNAIRSDRVHHAFLFTGARGVGKTSAARILAKALNCDEGMSPEPCNSCPSCQEIISGQGGDVHEIDGASNTGVESVRELRENIRYLPSRSRFKIFIIDEVHMLSTSAFNALLKTLEEPPAHAKFIFATTEPHKIPVTILSRCQRFDFRKIALPKVIARLREIVTAEGIEISDLALGLIAKRGEGSMRDALSTLDQVLAFCGDQVADQEVQGLLGAVDRRLLLDILRGIGERDCHRLLDAVRKADENGYALRQFSQELIEQFRALVVCQAVAEPGDLLDLTADELQEAKGLAAEYSGEELQRIITVLLKTEVELAHTTQPRLVLEMGLLRLAQMPQALEVGQLVQGLKRLERRLGAGGLETNAAQAPARVNRPSAPAPQPPSVPPPIEETKKKTVTDAPKATGEKNWRGLVAYTRQQGRHRIAAILEQVSLLDFALPQIVLAAPAGSFAFIQLDDEETQGNLRAMAEAYFGQPVHLQLKAGAAGNAPLPPSLQQERKVEESDRQRRLREDALEHEAIQSAKEIFGASLVEVRPIDKGFV